jgi:peptidoglycan/LPS O-acetylase OafA/YrhL
MITVTQPRQLAAIPLERPAIRETKPEAKSHHLEWIDVLRGFAAMWVIIYHSRSELWVGFNEIHRTPTAYSAFDRLTAWLSVPISFGGSAVMLFFVISGFCVHLPYAANSRPFEIKAYSLRRAWRILPPYQFAVLLTCLLEWLTYALGGPQATPWPTYFRAALLSQNYGDCGQLLTNGSLWSLPVEVELYVAYLAVSALLKLTNGILTASVVAMVSLVATLGYIQGHSELYLNFLRFWGIWCGGVLLAEWWKRGAMPKFGIVNGATGLLLGTCAIWGEGHHWAGGMLVYLWAGLYFHVIWLALRHARSIHQLPQRCVRLLVWLGTISYSAYLIHYPLFHLYGYLWRYGTGAKPSNFLVAVFFALSIWPVAWLFWKFCENPFHKLSQRLVKRTA